MRLIYWFSNLFRVEIRGDKCREHSCLFRVTALPQA